MAKKDYSEKLLDPRWQRKRLGIFYRDEFTCQACQDMDTTLHIHHKEYIRGREPWEYENENFQTLCKDCHQLVSYVERTYNAKIGKIVVQKFSGAGGFFDAYMILKTIGEHGELETICIMTDVTPAFNPNIIIVPKTVFRHAINGLFEL